MSSKWYVYIVRCADNSLYTGVATDVDRRVDEHNANNRLGARYTRGRRPVVLEYMEPSVSRAAACKRESEIKSLTKTAKEGLLKSRKKKKNRGGRS